MIAVSSHPALRKLKAQLSKKFGAEIADAVAEISAASATLIPVEVERLGAGKGLEQRLADAQRALAVGGHLDARPVRFVEQIGCIHTIFIVQ